MIVGVTATRLGLTDDQKLEVRRLLTQWRPHLVVHGGCVGGDDDIDKIAAELGIPRLIRPSNLPEQSIPTKVLKERRGSSAIILPEKPPLTRNLDIINDSERIIACPKRRKEELRSGTWMVIRNARRNLGKYNVEVVWP